MTKIEQRRKLIEAATPVRELSGTIADQLEARKRSKALERLKDAAVNALPRLLDEVERECVWVGDSDGFWRAGCGLAWEFNDDGPKENDAHYCMKCGGKIKEAGNE